MCVCVYIYTYRPYNTLFRRAAKPIKKNIYTRVCVCVSRSGGPTKFQRRKGLKNIITSDRVDRVGGKWRILNYGFRAPLGTYIRVIIVRTRADDTRFKRVVYIIHTHTYLRKRFCSKTEEETNDKCTKRVKTFSTSYVSRDRRA